MPTLILFIPKAPPQRLSFHNICPDGRTQIYILVYHNLPPFSSINIKSHKNVLFCNKMADNHQPNKVPIPNDKPQRSPPPQFRPTASAVQSPRIIAERLRISETAVFSYSIKSSTFPQPPFPPRRRSPFTSRRRLPTFNGTTPPRLLFQPSDYSHPNRDQPFFLRSRQVFLPLTCPYSPLSQLLRRCCFFLSQTAVLPLEADCSPRRTADRDFKTTMSAARRLLPQSPNAERFTANLFHDRRRSRTPPTKTPPEIRTSTHEKKQPEHNLLKKNEIVGSPIYNRGIL